MKQIAVIDYHMGNLRSVCKALEHVASPSTRVQVSHDPAVISGADQVVFPGQGAARDCMGEIHRLGLAACIREVITTRPFLGICMGLQVLLEGSDESPQTPCLGILAGRVRRRAAHTPAGSRLTIPQMGWNQALIVRDHPLWRGIESGERFYFANSYHAVPQEESVVTARTPYGIEFVSAVAQGSMFAVQFHPEKSQRAGLRLLANFVAWDGRA